MVLSKLYADEAKVRGPFHRHRLFQSIFLLGFGVGHLGKGLFELLSAAALCSFLNIFLSGQRRYFLCQGRRNELIDRYVFLPGQFSDFIMERIRKSTAALVGYTYLTLVIHSLERYQGSEKALVLALMNMVETLERWREQSQHRPIDRTNE